jgi:hypothetical protein
MPITTDQVIETITAAGLDYHDFRCEIIAANAKWDTSGNVWNTIAEFPRHTITDADWHRAWSLASKPNPYLDESAA